MRREPGTGTRSGVNRKNRPLSRESRFVERQAAARVEREAAGWRWDEIRTTRNATIFRDNERPETEHALATNILADYASDDPDRLSGLLMVADPKAYLSLFPVALKRAQ